MEEKNDLDLKVEVFLEHPSVENLNLNKFTQLENRLAALEKIVGIGNNPRVIN